MPSQSVTSSMSVAIRGPPGTSVIVGSPAFCALSSCGLPLGACGYVGSGRQRVGELPEPRGGELQPPGCLSASGGTRQGGGGDRELPQRTVEVGGRRLFSWQPRPPARRRPARSPARAVRRTPSSSDAARLGSLSSALSTSAWVRTTSDERGSGGDVSFARAASVSASFFDRDGAGLFGWCREAARRRTCSSRPTRGSGPRACRRSRRAPRRRARASRRVTAPRSPGSPRAKSLA